jgi:hypothetical protein
MRRTFLVDAPVLAGTGPHGARSELPRFNAPRNVEVPVGGSVNGLSG